MSIAPVESLPPVRSEPLEKISAASGQSNPHPQSAGVEEKRPAVSGTLPKQEYSLAKNIPSTYELPEDVVEVHQDPEIKGRIIIQYLDQSKNVVLQVPSNQELSVERGIAQELQQAAKLRQSAATAAGAGEGEQNHGD
jgi:hypothetical protein